MSTIKVDKIVPFQSSSVEIEGAIAVGGATTGSNDFVGNQTVTGSIDITGEFLVNGSPITGSGGDPIDTSSFATTGSNTFEGDQLITGSVFVSSSAVNDVVVDGKMLIFSNAGMAAQPQLTVSGSFVGGGVTNIFSTAVQVISGSNTGTVGRLSIVSGDSTGAPTTNRLIGIAGNPSALGAPSVSGLTKPSIYGLNASGQPDVVISLQHPGIYTDGTIEVRKNVEVSGNLVQNITAPAADTQTDFVSVSGSTIGGTPYEYTNFSLGNYSFFGTNYQNAFLFESYDSTAYNFGADFTVNGRSIGSYMLASGSDAPGRYGISQLRDNGFGKTFLNQYANIIHLGAWPEATTDEILIGHDTLPSLRLAASEVIITGSLHTSGSSTVTGNFVVNTVDELPEGIPGQIAFQGGNMHVYISGQWNQVQFVSSPPPPSSFEYDFGYDASNSGSACSATTSNVYSDVDTLAVGEFLWTGPGLFEKVDNGYYAGGGTWYEVTGGDGEITDTGACE
jgi:hypothetical protein